MSQYAEVLSAQKTMEDTFTQKMNDLAAQLQSAGTTKDTIAKVAEEFRTFRELVFSMLKLLRQQINECARQVDSLEARSRRKSLVFLGVQEAEKEDCSAVILDILSNKLSLNTVPKSSIKICHRLGTSKGEHHRPILVKFCSIDSKILVWRAKKQLKGSAIAVREFLTKSRQEVFSKARLHFGMRAVWTQDGIIHVKAPDSSHHKISSLTDLDPLLSKFPKFPGHDKCSASGSGSHSIGHSKLK